MSPSKLFLSVCAAILAAAFIIAGAKCGYSKFKDAQLEERAEHEDRGAAEQNIYNLEAMLRDMTTVAEKREIMEMAWKFQRQVEARLSTTRNPDDRLYWKDMLSRVESLRKKILEAKMVHID